MEIVYSVIVPVYNAESTIRELHQRITVVMTGLQEPYEILFVDDGSVDSSWVTLEEIAQADTTVSIIRLNRNFGQHNAIMCGFHHVRGKWVITLDDDLQNPPEEIVKLIHEKDKGFDLVYGIYEDKKHSGMRNLGSAFVLFMFRNTFKMDKNISSFRIIDGDIVRAVTCFDNSFIILDGLFVWHTNSISNVVVEHNERATGKTGYSLRKLIILGINLLTNFSTFPVQIASVLGFVFSIFGFILGVYFFVMKIFSKVSVPGYTSLIVAIAIFSGAQLLSIGIIGEYISRIFHNLNKKPQFYEKRLKERRNAGDENDMQDI
jgi:undecaprenyl-phosphate 4-deoxy-4-formamido-L-arabinose transferase